MLTKSASKPLRWQKHKYSLLARQRDIFGSAATLIFYLWWDATFTKDSPEHRKRRAEWLVRTLLDLGPTFIKIGQALSTRADLLPLEYVQALGQLQDKVPPFGGDQAIALIEAELGNSIHTLYRDFDRFPLAAASLGQVHKARLHTGEDVIVKVQRPGLDKLFTLDFQALHKLERFCFRYLPWTRKYELATIYNEFFNLLYQEIDYIQEGKNADKFRENFNNYPQVTAPKIYWRYTTTKVLTMEYLPGIKINDRQTLEACGLNAKQINQIGICCYLKQLLIDGFFQADPHPGNMAVSQDGNLIIYDFGMMVELKPLAKDQMVKTFWAVLKKDAEELTVSLIDMGLIVEVSDMKPIKRMLTFILDKFTEKPINVKEFGQMRNELYAMFEQQPFRLPAQMTFIIKSLTTLDGIARVLDPEYNMVAAAQPFIRSIAVSKGQGNVIAEFGRQAKSFIQYKLTKPSAAELLIYRLEKRIEEGELQFRVLSVESDRTFKRMNVAIKSLTYACFTGLTLLSGAVLLIGSYSSWAMAAFILSGLSFLVFLRSLISLAIMEKFEKVAKK